MLLWLMACGEWLVPPEPEPPVEAPAPRDNMWWFKEDPKSFSVPVGHCNPGERPVFSCASLDVVYASLCERDGVSFRYGKPKKVTLRVPSERAFTKEIAVERTGADVTVTVAGGPRIMVMTKGGETKVEVQADATQKLECHADLRLDLDELEQRYPPGTADDTDGDTDD